MWNIYCWWACLLCAGMDGWCIILSSRQTPHQHNDPWCHPVTLILLNNLGCILYSVFLRFLYFIFCIFVFCPLNIWMGTELVHIYFANFEIDLFAQPTPSDVSTQPEGVSKLAESALCEIIWYFSIYILFCVYSFFRFILSRPFDAH